MAKRIKQIEGYLEFDRIVADNTDTLDLSEAIKESVPHVGYTGQLKTLRELAAKAGLELDELHQAEELIRAGGDHFEIRSLFKDAKYKIQVHVVEDRKTWFSEIAATFRKATDRWEKRAKNALNALGFTTGKRRPRFDREQMLLEYTKLLEGTDEEYAGTSLDKWKAIEVLTGRHETASQEATLQHLRRYVNEEKKNLEAEGKPTDHLKKILPGNPCQ